MRDYGDRKITGVLMVGRREHRNGSATLHAPLLGDDYTDDAKENRGLHHDEVVVSVRVDEGFDRSASVTGRRPSLGDQQEEQLEPNYDTPELETASRNTFQQIHELNRPRSNDYSHRGGWELPVSRSKRRRHTIRNPIHQKSLVARAAYSAKTDTLNFLYNVLIGLYMWPKWSLDAIKANKSLTVLSAKQGVLSSILWQCCI